MTAHTDTVWLFGYGSLIYKVDFPWLERRPAWLQGWARRFWQGSHDHRGTPEAPGRVVTLIASAGARCRGMAYRISPDVFAHLDHREKNGYARRSLEFCFDDGGCVQGVVYVADPANEALPFELRADASCALDDCRIETELGSVDASLDAQLQRLAQAWTA